MSIRHSIMVDAWLAPYREPLPQLACRLATLNKMLSQLNPFQDKLYLPPEWQESELVPENPADLAPIIKDNQRDTDASDRLQSDRYFFGAYTRPDVPDPDPKGLKLMGWVGGNNNRIFIETAWNSAIDPKLNDFKLLKAMAFAFWDAFEPPVVMVDPGTLNRDVYYAKRPRPPFSAEWMFLLSPLLAAKVEPPRNVVVERYDDGRLFLAATDERFDASNEKHIAAAAAIEEALAPVNDWSWFKNPSES